MVSEEWSITAHWRYAPSLKESGRNPFRIESGPESERIRSVLLMVREILDTIHDALKRSSTGFGSCSTLPAAKVC